MPVVVPAPVHLLDPRIEVGGLADDLAEGVDHGVCGRVLLHPHQAPREGRGRRYGLRGIGRGIGIRFMFVPLPTYGGRSTPIAGGIMGQLDMH